MNIDKVFGLLSNRVSNQWNGSVLGCVFAGSHSYGLATEASDVDLRAFHSVHPDHLLGLYPLSKSAATIEIMDDETEMVSHEMGKFFELCMKGNPSVVELLFTPVDNIYYESSLFAEIRTPEIRNAFLDEENIVSSYFGYSKSQLMRMTNQLVEDKDKMRKANIKFSEPESIVNFLNENIYLNAEYEYNHKLASHCLRLLVSLNYFIKNGELIVHMGNDAEWLMKYKSGEYSYGSFMLKLYDILMEVNNCRANSKIPKQQDKDKINNILLNYRKNMIEKG